MAPWTWLRRRRIRRLAERGREWDIAEQAAARRRLLDQARSTADGRRGCPAPVWRVGGAR